MKRLFLLLALAAVAAAASAQQYKWVDKDGKLRYGDVPPPGVKAIPLRAPPPGAPAAAPAAKDAAGKALSPEQAFRKRQEEAEKDREKQAKADQEAQEKRENCARAQDALRALESGQRISRTDSKGERYFLDESQMAQETVKARQTVQQWCN